MSYYVYMILTKINDKYISYVGYTQNVKKRLSLHNNSKCAKFTKGKFGEEFTIWLQLKTIADIGIIGLPNAGKSSLLAAITNANPKIANYQFTTLNPNLGVANYDEKEVTIDWTSVEAWTVHSVSQTQDE